MAESQKNQTEKENIVELKTNIYLLSIIGEVEGHESLGERTKATRYEHILPALARAEEDKSIDGLLILLNTVGGDVEAGLAIAEMIASMRKPAVSLVLGGGHSIGVPLAVAADYSLIVPSATMVIHPVRTNGMFIGVAQTYRNMEKTQDRITGFVSAHSKITKERLEELMLDTKMLVKDVGTMLDGPQAVEEGLIDEVGGIARALEMTVIEALFLGLIQGVTEFLPISSSAHLIIFRHFMKIEDTQTVFFNVLLHFGSMIAILLTFSKEWKRLFLALCGIIIDLFHNLKEHFSSQHQERKQYRKVLGSNYRMLAFLLILTTIPTAVIGGMIQSLVTLTSSNLLAPGVGLYLTAILLVVADMLPEGEKTQKNLKPKDALIAGFFQGFSTIPGLSRLGSTISACVIGGMTRSYAVKYSLIVSVPAIIGATIVEIATM